MLCVPFVFGQDDSDAVSLDVTMKFDLSGGTDGPDSISGWDSSNSSYFDMFFTIPEKVPTKAGYTFVKWVLPDDVEFAEGSVGMDGFYPGTMYSVTVTGLFSTFYAEWAVDLPELKFISDPITNGTISYSYSAELIVYGEDTEAQSREGQ